MGWYDDRILPTLVGLSCGTKPIHKQREKVVPRAAGDVLEIGADGIAGQVRYTVTSEDWRRAFARIDLRPLRTGQPGNSHGRV